MTLNEMTALARTSPLIGRQDDDEAAGTDRQEIAWRVIALAEALDASPAEVVASGRIGKALSLRDDWWDFLSALPARLPVRVGASSRDCAWQAGISLGDLSITTADFCCPGRMVNRLEIDIHRVSWAFVVREEDAPEPTESLLLFGSSGELLLTLRVPRERGRLFLFGYQALARKRRSNLQITTAVHQLAQRSPASADKAAPMVEFKPVREISVSDIRLLLHILADHLLPIQGVVGSRAAVAGWEGNIHSAGAVNVGDYRFGNMAIRFLPEGQDAATNMWFLGALVNGPHDGLVLHDYRNCLWLSLWLEPDATHHEKSTWLAIIDIFVRSVEATQ